MSTTKLYSIQCSECNSTITGLKKKGSTRCFGCYSTESIMDMVIPRSDEELAETASCGHYLRDGHCLLFCDDYVRNTNGLCYLKVFTDRKEMFDILGFYPSANDLFEQIEKKSSGVVYPFQMHNFGKYLHIGFLPLCEPTMDATMICRGCHRTKHMRCSTYTRDEKTCSKCGSSVLMFITPNLKCSSMKVGHLDLEELVMKAIQGECSPLNSPMTYTTESLVRYVAKAEREDDLIRLSCGPNHNVFEISSQRLRSMKHDYVASEWRSETDESLSLIGVPMPEGRLSPDYIDAPSKFVLELGTTISSTFQNLRNAYDQKAIKYGDIISSVKGTLLVLIVGHNKIVTNLHLTPNEAQVLCSRLSEVRNLEFEIPRLCNMDVFRSTLTDEMKIAQLSFEKIPMKAVESKHYKIKEIEQFDGSISIQDTKDVNRILTDSLKESRHQPRATKDDLHTYLEGFENGRSRSDLKRICNIPMIIVSGAGTTMTRLSKSTMPDELYTIWNSSSPNEVTYKQSEILYEHALNNDTKSGEHFNKKRNMFKPHLTEDNKIALAMSGIGGREYDENDSRKAHEAHSKKSFHPNVDTSDITSFLSHKWLQPYKNNFMPSVLTEAVINSKAQSTGGLNQDSVKIWKETNNTMIISFSYMITYIFTELAYNYKQWTSGYQFLRRDLKFGISVVVYNPKGHLFVSFCMPKKDVHVVETGRIGPKLHDVGTHLISDFCSFNEPTLEHFIKMGPYMSSILTHLQSNSEANPLDISKYTKSALPNIMLLFLNNKTDVEELITSQRYLFMKLLEDVPSSPWLFIDRFPAVLRSRLTAYYLWKTINLMDHYAVAKIGKVAVHHETMIMYEYNNVRSLFCDHDITLAQKINEFYFGYVVSKERGRGSDRTFKVLSKILEQEYNFRDKVDKIFTTTTDTPKFSSNTPLLKFMTHQFCHLLKARAGENFKDRLYNEFISEASYTNFSKLSTLKASARNHPQDFKTKAFTDESLKDIYKTIKEMNPEEEAKRPKAMEAIIKLVNEFRVKYSRDPAHVVELVPWCLNDLIEKGYFDSDCFAKPQHGGDREIHVLEIKARIVQYHVELFSKVVCKFFPSETTVNSGTKDHFVKQHYQESKYKLGNFQSHNKSADASKWCQAHHSSHFAAMFSAICPDQLKPFLLSALSLWPKKRLSFPLTLTSSLIKNAKLESVSPLYNRFRNDNIEGKDVFTQKMGNKIEIQSGMFQGILHHTSSLYHTMIQEVYKVLVETICLQKYNMPVHVSIIQGSDDSGAMISFKGSLNKKQILLAKTLLGWKENIAKHLSIYWNVCKSSIGTHDLIEYNSEWHSRHKIIKPTFRWISASLEMSVTERFIDRFRIFNNVLGQCLEGGASTLECSVVQLNQASLHYCMMGFQTQSTSSLLWRSMSQHPDPLVGFFPCDFDVAAGVTGVEFQLYCLFRFSKYGNSLRSKLSTDVELSFIPDELPNYMKVKDLQSIKLSFSNMNIYQSLVRRLPLESFEKAIQDVEEDPLIVFSRKTSWKEDQPNLVLKVFSPGVKESVSNISPLLRMVASSAYLQTLPCFRVRGVDGKITLPWLVNRICTSAEKKPKDSEVFPLHHEFSKVLDMIQRITNDSIMQDVILKKTSKSKIVVFEVLANDYPLIDMCKRRWFSLGSIPLSRSQFNEKWQDYMVTYPFLSASDGFDGLKETCLNLNMNVIECKSFLESMNQRTRSVTLYDSSSKSKNLSHSLSRIYWPNTKLLFSAESSNDLHQLRSKIFSMVSYWNDNDQKGDAIRRWILDSKTLSLNYKDIPAKGKKLKIFRDYLEGKKLSSIIPQIISMKQGCIGSFISVQRGFGAERKGVGIWAGQVCGVNTEIRMRENTCLEIRVQSMSESVSLARSLSRLLQEFNCSVSEDKREIMKLGPNGNFHHNRSAGTPITVYPDLRFSHVDNLENCKWELELTDFNLRLKVTEHSKYETGKYTILSDSFTSRDWMEECPIISERDANLVLWSMGTQCPLNTLIPIVGTSIPSTRGAFLQLVNSLKNRSYKGRWNLECFRLAIISAFKLDTRITVNAKEDDEILTDAEKIAAAEIYDQIAMMNWDDADLDAEITNWADEVETHLDTLLHDVGEQDDNQIDEMIKSLMYGSNNEPYLEEKEEIRTMPHSTKFFSNLNTLSMAYSGQNFYDLVTDCKHDTSITVPGILGKVVSLVLRRFVFVSEIDDNLEHAEMESQISALTTSMKSHQDLSHLTLDEAQKKLRVLREMYGSATSSLKAEAIRLTIQKYEMMIDTKMQGNYVADFCFTFENLMDATADTILSKKLKFHEMLPKVRQFQEPIIKTAMISHTNPYYADLSDAAKFSLESAFTNKLVTLQLLNLICANFDINIITDDLNINSNSKNVMVLPVPTEST